MLKLLTHSIIAGTLLFLSGFSIASANYREGCPQITDASQCVTEHVLKADWAAKDQAALDGRRLLSYYILRSKENIDFYSLGQDINLDTIAVNDTNVIAFINQHFNRLSNTVNLQFDKREEMDPNNLADITIAFINFPGEARGWAGEFLHDKSKAILLVNVGDYCENSCTTLDDANQAAGVAMKTYIFLHELGHILGLKHPFEENQNKKPPCNYPEIKKGPQARPTTDLTLMAYERSPELAKNRDFTWYRPLDIASLCDIWGPKE